MDEANMPMDATIDVPRRLWRNGPKWVSLEVGEDGEIACPLCALAGHDQALRKLPLLGRYYCYRNHFLESSSAPAGRGLVNDYPRVWRNGSKG